MIYREYDNIMIINVYIHKPDHGLCLIAAGTGLSQVVVYRSSNPLSSLSFH